MLAAPALAQDAPAPEDLRALQYYTEQGDTVARDAELRRLRRAYPGWTPPSDLGTLGGPNTAADEQRIYDLIAGGRLDAARAAMNALQTEYPSWTPPAEMERLLRLAEGQSALDSAFAESDLGAAAQEARNVPDLLRCDRVNNAWRLAELQAAAGDRGPALQSYTAIVNACTDFNDIVATIEKAEMVATDSELQALISRARRRFPTRAQELDALERRLLAGRGVTVREATPRDGAAASPSTRRTAPRASAGTSAPSRGRGNKKFTIYGALPRSGDGRLGATQAAAAKSQWGQCLRVSTNPRSLDVAYQRAWCAYNMERPLEAIALFQAALEGRVNTQDARYGLALSFVNLDMTEEAAEVAASGDLTREQRRSIERIILDQRAVRAYNNGEYLRAIAFFDALEASYGLRRDLAILRAYAYLNSKQMVRAHTEFLRMDQEFSTPDSRAGLKASTPDP